MGGQRLNYAHDSEPKHQYLDLPYCKLEGIELASKEPNIWESFMTLHLAIEHGEIRNYFVRKYEDLYGFYITLEDELAYELNYLVKHVEWARSNKTYKE